MRLRAHPDSGRSSAARSEVVDITGEADRVLAETKIEAGQCTVFTPLATAAITITINENDGEASSARRRAGVRCATERRQ